MSRDSLNYDTHYTKGWSDRVLWRDFVDAQDAGDLFTMDCIIRAQGAERPPVDARVIATPSSDVDLMAAHTVEYPVFESQERGDEYHLLRRLEDLRDYTLNNLPSDLPEPLRKLSYFAKHQTVDPLVPEQNFMTTMDEYEAIQRGDKPLKTAQRLGSLLPMKTGRDLATFVWRDNPMINWMPVAAELLDLGVPKRTYFSPNTPDCNADSDFTCWGAPKLFGMLGEVLERVGHLSFREKWFSMAPRPEEYGPKMGVGLLSQTFPEGSPTHPSFTAMHAFLAYAMGYLLLEIFDGYFELPNGNSVECEVNLWAENIAYGRLWAGVHYASDNEQTKPRARALAKRVANEHLHNHPDLES